MQTQRRDAEESLLILNKMEFKVKDIKQGKEQHYNEKRHNF